MARDYVFTSDEQFLENWLQFAVFHRTREAIGAAEGAAEASDDGFRASFLLAAMQAYFQAFEDLGMWADAIRRYRSNPDSSLVACMDKADVKWSIFFPKLEKVDATAFARFYGLRLPSESADPAFRKRYEGDLSAWAEAARAVAAIAAKMTDNDRQLLYRTLNKLKHGLLVSANSLGGQPAVLFYPERSSTTVWKQLADTDAAETYAKETFAVSRLLTVTLRVYFASQFRREPGCGWYGKLPPRVNLLTLDEVREIVRVPTLPAVDA